jgi:hypothetical protein
MDDTPVPALFCGYWSASTANSSRNVFSWTRGYFQKRVKQSSVTAIPQLLAVLDIAGYAVTIDAMWCQKEIAKDSINKKRIISCPSRKNIRKLTVRQRNYSIRETWANLGIVK